jgi:hypothetical protein
LSRACLGKMIVFTYKWLKRCRFSQGMWWFQAGTMIATHNHIQEGPRDAFGVYGVRFGSLGTPNYGVNKVRMRKQRAFFEPFIHKSHLFTKTGSGQT